MIQVATSRGKASGQAQILLSQIFRADPEGCLARIPELPEAGKKLLEGLQARLRPTAEATPDQLPAVLLNPPWLAKKSSKKVEKVQLSLETLPIEPQERWPEGLRESWMEAQENWMPEEGESPRDRLILLLDELGLKHSYAKLADSADPALRAKLEAEIPKVEEGWASIGALTYAPEELALWLLNHCHPGRWWTTPEDLKLVCATYGRAGLPGLIGVTRKKPLEALEVLLPFGHPGGGPLAAGALRRKRERAAAERWLRSWPEVGAITLLPLALGKAGKERENAEVALRWLHNQGFGSLLTSVAQAYGAGEGLESLLSFDPLSLHPAKAPKMPDFWDPGSYSRPRLRSGEALPLSAVEILGQMLAFSELDPPYAGIVQVREACDPTSLADFAWDLFNSWSFAGLPTSGGWVLRAQGLLGNDDTARRLTPLIRAWPGEGGNARALTGLEVLAAIGSDVALMHLNGMAQKVKFRGLQEAAREKIRALAEQRGLDEAELADRLVPDLGLEEDGSLVLDFGPRQYTVGFDELLRPY
ncbi:MAG TPA: polymerase, partial [Myxococcota bacterium]|nr:polymerase [Myxococcota bacterium]